jgi:hypothetical protein
MLSITCDNASANDTMINHLANLIEAFPGSGNRTRCFAHVLNLVAKCIMKQFDLPGKKRGKDGKDSDEEVNFTAIALEALAEEIEDEKESGEEGGSDSGEENDKVPFNGREGMTEAEIKKLDENVRPVRLVLAKVICLNDVISMIDNHLCHPA